MVCSTSVASFRKLHPLHPNRESDAPVDINEHLLACLCGGAARLSMQSTVDEVCAEIALLLASSEAQLVIEPSYGV